MFFADVSCDVLPFVPWPPWPSKGRESTALSLPLLARISIDKRNRIGTGAPEPNCWFFVCQRFCFPSERLPFGRFDLGRAGLGRYKPASSLVHLTQDPPLCPRRLPRA